ncbi:hypothetical protein [Nocardia altamirensis]|uniref:hypothetical protein n=1 Tax=Nocardia altamirensis TaxID=472158 RepID=UPI0008403A7F|nr:hypothetical protein [Nocardia altamirensis]
MTTSGHPAGEQRPRRGTALSVAIGICLLLLAVLAGCLLRDEPAPSVAASRAVMTSNPPIDFGVTAGKVLTNNGGIITVTGFLGAETIVYTTARTKVLMLGGTRLSDVRVGDTVFVHGDKKTDGTITAKVIIGGSSWQRPVR